ncbi:unnamed protein product, partial [Rangifer tarandus platyrhynchus]
LPPPTPSLPSSEEPSRVAGRSASCGSVCRGLHAHTEMPFFPSQFSSVPKFTP